MPLSNRDRADMLQDGLNQNRREQLSAANKMTPARPRTLEYCFSFFDSAQELRPTSASKIIPVYREFKL
jgi:hypothetical protein